MNNVAELYRKSRKLQDREKLDLLKDRKFLAQGIEIC